MSAGRCIADETPVRWIFLAIAIALCACSSVVVTGNPWSYVPLKGVQLADKVDILFAVDDSPSMGDKQALLGSAVPTLVGRLLNPRCIDANASNTCSVGSDCTSLGPGADCDPAGNSGKGQCFVPGDGVSGDKHCSTIAGTKSEFFPVHDLHVGIVSSSLGGGGAPDVCATGADDKGHLLNRTAIKNAQPVDGGGGNFLAWLPANDPSNQGKTPPNVTAYIDGQPNAFTADFQSLVLGVQEHGCGLEAQLESWYRFLVQPDPYDTIQMSNDNPPRATMQGVDVTLLKMRHDFLRPDSLVVIVQLTDEEDSWSDPLWLGGYGWTSRTMNFPGGPGGGAGPRGTSECDQPEDINNPTTWGPNNPDCTSCAFPSANKPISKSAIGNDPNCKACPQGETNCAQKGWWDPPTWNGNVWTMDGLNVRYGSQYMRTRYGFDNQHDVMRYVDGLRSATVPDRDNEAHPPTPYTTTKRNCTNPLFAQDLPDGSDSSPAALCMLKAGARTPDHVFYALIGGVPNELVQKPDLSPDDWVKIVGKDPAHYIFDGIDSHMIESTTPRSTLQSPGTTYSLGSDPINGREWNTLTSSSGVDLQYACTFDLPAPKDCTSLSADACECQGTEVTANDGPPLCSPANRTTQVKGKAYPTIRELRVAQGLGSQSVVSSLCAKDVTSAVTSPTYGYNPAMNAIVNRLDTSLGGQCLGATLPVDGCILVVSYPDQTDQSVCDSSGLQQPPASLLKDYQASYRASLDAGPSQPVPALCELPKLATCGVGPGWCYETNTDGCAQKIAFAPGSPPPGTTISLACTATTN
jgi:hypothetical protein